MFPDDDADTEERYAIRADIWKERRFGRTRHAFWWAFHNAVVHPLLTIPIKPTHRLHDWASRKLAGG